MASQHNNFFKLQSPESGLVLDNRNFFPSQDTSLQWEEDICNFSTAQLNFPTNDNGYCAKQELQAMWKWFTSWLKPEKRSKEQMISQLVLAEFLKTGHYKVKSALKEKWESNGRNLGRFMEDLTDECLKPPIMVIHTSMQGQEALFSKNMSLEETNNLLKEQQSARSSIQESTRTPLPIPQDMLLTTGHEDSEDSQNNGWSNSDVNDGDSSPGNEMDSLSLIQQVQFNEPKDRSVSDGNPLDLSRTSQVTSRYQEEFHRGTSSEDVPMEVQPEITSSPEQTEDCQNPDASSTPGRRQKRPLRDSKTYKCEECPRTFKYPSRLAAHQRIHKKQKSFVCKTCHKGFYTRSDLRVHKVIHQENKPFKCSTCGKSFSNQTNLKAHERIHTGEKPYTCSLCNRSFRQSSTYHRHRRNCHKAD
ncbi:zinc finger and SCAN domain-containing protein 4-like [Peromyscus eremicus]|uniref:zinc finger and SCAN domain-containing protein 4-like n=1 Tax=Peromyscus eremicus TaxID=42410 RepID=UPI0027DB2979|nr:zinc finger and SCAN domain-containing protein 4-like [Peromyscus eremicus]